MTRRRITPDELKDPLRAAQVQLLIEREIMSLPGNKNLADMLLGLVKRDLLLVNQSEDGSLSWGLTTAGLSEITKIPDAEMLH